MRIGFRLDAASGETALARRAQAHGRTPSGEACAIVQGVLKRQPVPDRAAFVALMESNRMLAQLLRSQRAPDAATLAAHIVRVDRALAACVQRVR